MSCDHRYLYSKDLVFWYLQNKTEDFSIFHNWQVGEKSKTNHFSMVISFVSIFSSICQSGPACHSYLVSHILTNQMRFVFSLNGNCKLEMEFFE